MMFNFFPNDNDEDEDGNEQSNNSSSNQQQPPPPCRQIIVTDKHVRLTGNVSRTNNSFSTIKVCSNDSVITLKCIDLIKLSQLLLVVDHQDDDGLKRVAEILKSSSDLESGVYEGGFKTWECSFDLCDYLYAGGGELEKVLKRLGYDNNAEGNNKNNLLLRVLDLGCGSGVLGLSVLKMFEQQRFGTNVDVRVDFQDYNEEVLDNVTIPNTLLNFTDDNETICKCSWYSGDWSNFNIDGVKQYDLILSSETIYNLEYLERFVGVVKRCLGVGGCLYLAAKTFYFGVGGGTKAFLELVGKDKELEWEVVKAFKEGVHREIIRVRRNKTTKDQETS